MKYRSDINGLRALAVIPVLFFHAHLQGFEGGFLGVDIFFVISGFLITTLIFNDLENGKFSILSFWNKRLRRILPALIFISLITTIISFFTMLPYDLKNYGQSLVATILSANNILLYLTSGYWSLATEFKPLYHTWSLGVEDQYYFFIPLIMIFIYKKFNALVLLIVLLFISSFTLSYFSDNKELNFLIITHRMWELLAGSLVTLFLSKYKVAPNNLIATIGLAFIVFSYIFPYYISNNQAIYTLLPVVGTVIIILYSSNSTKIGKILSIKPLLFLGTISYSIYLFHMPLLVFLRLSVEGEAEVYLQSIFVLFSIPLAYLSWRYVENVFRYKNKISNKNFYTILIFLSTILFVIGLSLHYSYGFQSYSKYNYGKNPQKYCDEPNKYIKTNFISNKSHLLIIGNSFARDFINMIRANDKLDKFEIILLPSAQQGNAINLIKQADIVIAVSSAGMTNVINKKELIINSKKLFQLLKMEAKGKFYLVGTKNFGFNNNFLINKDFQNIPKYSVSVNSSTFIANEIEKEIWRNHYIDILKLIMNDDKKVPVFTNNGNFISFDTEHATKDGAKFIGNILFTKTQLKDIFL
ncbi:acyltransferase [Sulfurimonas sp.]|uniref:acyltransferase family protein n=1 Tax=Sulfurimonas sp. TaxID=2022749 RepID=UPI002AAFABCB|nr:acyltransferase [Sulfurimonas sp.]